MCLLGSLLKNASAVGHVSPRPVGPASEDLYNQAQRLREQQERSEGEYPWAVV